MYDLSKDGVMYGSQLQSQLMIIIVQNRGWKKRPHAPGRWQAVGSAPGDGWSRRRFAKQGSARLQGFLYDIRTSVIAFMMIFNPDLILYNINNWPQGIMIFIMTLIAMAAFTNLTQGFCVKRNRWYESPFFMLATIILFYPGIMTGILKIDFSNRYYIYIIGLVIYGFVILMQKVRKE